MKRKAVGLAPREFLSNEHRAIEKALSTILTRRALDAWPTLLRNAAVFVTVTPKFGSQRESDQYGTLIAGAWSSMNPGLVTPQQAKRMIAHYGWPEHIVLAKASAPNEALSTLLAALIPSPRGEMVSVFQLASCAAGKKTDTVELDAKVANDILRRHGLAVAPDPAGITLLVSNTSCQIPRLLKGTPFATDFRGHLLNCKGTRKHGPLVSFNGHKSRCVAVDLARILMVGSSLSPTSSYPLGQDKKTRVPQPAFDFTCESTRDKT